MPTTVGIDFVIRKIGDREALQSLDLLDEKGRKTVEAIAGRLGKALGDTAAMYQKAGSDGQKYLDSMAKGYQRLADEEARTARQAEQITAGQERGVGRLEGRQAHALASASRGLEMVGRTGQLTGRSLDAVVGQVSALAFSFGPQGQLVAAIGIATAGIVEMFMRTSREAKKLAAETAKEIEGIYNSGNYASAADRVAGIYSGQAFAPNKLDRLSLPDERRQAAELQRKIAGQYARVGNEGGSSVELTEKGKVYAAQLAEINKHLKDRSALYDELTRKGGVMDALAAKQVQSDQAGFTTDAIHAQEQAAEKLRKANERAAKERAREAERYAKELASDLKDIAAKMVEEAEPSDSARAAFAASLFPSKEMMREQASEMKILVSESVKDTIDNNPILKAGRSSAATNKRLGEELGRDLGAGLAAGLESGFAAAFKGEGIAKTIGAFGDSMLKALGGIFIKQGEALISFSAIMKGLGFALADPLTAPWAAAAEGAALIALGAALSAAAGGGGGGSSGGGFGGSSSSLAQIIDRGTIVPGSYSAMNAKDIQARPSLTFNLGVLNPNDGATQRIIDEINRKIDQRGSLS